MVTNLKEAKARLSELIELASSGEEILITVRGKAKARLCPVQESLEQEVAEWGRWLEDTRARYKVKCQSGGGGKDTQSFWDALRGSRR